MNDQEDMKNAGDMPATITEENKVKKKSGVISRIWNSVFRLQGDDFEKRLQRISKEEAAILSRMKKRALSWRKMSRHLITFSVFFEVIAICYAILTTRTLDLNRKNRALRILPMFLFPALASLAYLACVSFTKMCDHNDRITLERLRNERQDKINELKEKTNYYTTQQLIQRYDPDPAAKAAAATVLASKLGADSGLQLFMGDEMKYNPPLGRSNDTELVQSNGLRKRKQPYSVPGSPESIVPHYFEEEMMQYAGSEGLDMPENDQMIVQHQNPSSFQSPDGGWLARLAALLVGEDPTQSYALICGHCHRHNGLARKEDFEYITYYCPHCNTLNRHKKMEPVVSDLNSLTMGSSLASSPVVAHATLVDDASAVPNDSESLSSSNTSDSSSPTLNHSAFMSNKEPENISPALIPSASISNKEPDNSTPAQNSSASMSDKEPDDSSPALDPYASMSHKESDNITPAPNSSACVSNMEPDNDDSALNPSASMSNKGPDNSNLVLNTRASMSDMEPDSSSLVLNDNLPVYDKVSDNSSPVASVVENRESQTLVSNSCTS